MATKENAVKDLNVPTNVPVEITTITQAELIDFIALSNQIEKLTAEYDTQTLNLKNLLAAGAPVEEGVHVAILKLSERRSVSWKIEAIALADKLKGKGEGEKWANKVIARTVPSPIVSLDVH
jgi:hypothetical protein